jgi:hypothetical protein
LLVAPVDTHCHLKKMVLEKWTKDHGTRHPKTESLILLYHGAATNETRSKSSAPQITFVPHMQQVGRLESRNPAGSRNALLNPKTLCGFGRNAFLVIFFRIWYWACARRH